MPDQAPPPGRLPSGRHGLTPEAVAAAQRERLVRSMAEVVAQRGYAATSVAHVLEHAGVSRRTFYEQFPDKAACFMAALEVSVAVLHHEVSTAYETPGTWARRAARGIVALLRTVAEHPAYARTCIVEVLAAGPEALERYGSAIGSFLPFLEDGLEQDPGLPPELPSFVAGGVVHLLYGHIVAGDVERLPGEAPTFVRLALQPYVGAAKAARQASASV